MSQNTLTSGVSPPRRRGRRPRLAQVDPGRCTGCGRCVPACEPQLLSLEVQHWKKRAVLHGAEHCSGCRLCERRCPFRAITMGPVDPDL